MALRYIVLATLLSAAIRAVADTSVDSQQPKLKEAFDAEAPYLAPIESGLFSKNKYYDRLRELLMPTDWTAFGIAPLPRSKLGRLWFRCICTSSDTPEWMVGVVSTDKPWIVYAGFGTKLISKEGELLDVSVEHRAVEISKTLREALVEAMELVVGTTRAQPRPEWTATSQVYYFNVNGAEGRATNPKPESRPGKLASLARALRDCALQGTPVSSDQEQSMLRICQSIRE